MMPATSMLPRSAVTLIADAASSAWPPVSLPMTRLVLAVPDGPISVPNSKLRLAVKPPAFRPAFMCVERRAARQHVGGLGGGRQRAGDHREAAAGLARIGRAEQRAVQRHPAGKRVEGDRAGGRAGGGYVHRRSGGQRDAAGRALEGQRAARRIQGLVEEMHRAPGEVEPGRGGDFDGTLRGRVELAGGQGDIGVERDRAGRQVDLAAERVHRRDRRVAGRAGERERAACGEL